MREDFVSIHPQNLADFAQHLHSVGVGLEYDPQEHLREWKAVQERRAGDQVATFRPAHGGMDASLTAGSCSDTQPDGAP